jgi:secondary thiamine-phosphate synthase enzyme
MQGGKMQPAVVYTDSITVKLDTGPDIVDVTGKFNRIIKQSGIQSGNLAAAIVGSTGSITTIEYEPGVVDDLKEAINRIAPPGIYYAHEEAWHDGNGHSHVQAALLGPSISLPIRKGRLKLGTWQQVVVINHDNKSRQRVVEVTIVGTD